MERHCDIEIYDRLTEEIISKRAVFLRFENINGQVYLRLETRRFMRRYEMYLNIKEICKKFIADGKFTIEFYCPCDDLSVKNGIHLEDFICEIEEASCGEYWHALESTSAINKYKYQNLQSFPQGTTELSISGLDITIFNPEIFRLQNLIHLDLSKNKISSLPKELGTLPHLKFLYISNNLLGISPQYEWAWLEQSAIQQNLTILDISSNNLTKLPLAITTLTSLRLLRISRNKLTRLPQSIINTSFLTFLDIDENDLSYLPGSIIHMRIYAFLKPLYALKNPLLHNEEHYITHLYTKNTLERVVSLKELSARRVDDMIYRLKYNVSLIPFTLAEYLHNVKYCYICYFPCFDHYIRKYFLYPQYSVIAGVTSDIRKQCIMEGYFCSLECADKEIIFQEIIRDRNYP